MVDLRQSAGWARYLKTINFEVFKIAGQNAYAKRIPFLGTIIKIQRPARLPSEREMDELAQRVGALFIKLEPNQAYNSQDYPGFELDQNPNIPTRTILINLEKKKDELWQKLSPDARQSIKRAKKLKIEVMKFGEDNFIKKLKIFHRLLDSAGQRGHFGPTALKELEKKCAAFGEDAFLFLAYPEEGGEPLAGALILKVNDVAFDCHAASSNLGLKEKASYLLIWEIIRILKKEGEIKYLDLEGIADPRFPQTRKWEGFSVFKRKWGGEEVSYPRPLIKFYNTPLKLLFKLGAAFQR